KTSKTTAKNNQSQRQLGRIITIVFIVFVAANAFYFISTGSDPFGLFTLEEPTPTAVIEDESIADVGGGTNWWEVYFTNPNEINDPENLSGSIPEKLIEYIDNAETSIHIAAFELNLTPVANALIEAHRRGVDVKWVTDDEHGLEADEEEDHGQFKMLTDSDIKVLDDGRSALMHNKFIIFDNEIVWTGSTNLTLNGNFRNNNNVLVIHSPELAQIFEVEFVEMLDGEFGPTSPSTSGDQNISIDGTPIQVLFAAEDDVISKLIPLVENAEKSIRFMAFSFTHDDLGSAVLARAEAGVDVKGIFEKRGSETEYSEMPGLYCAGVDVRQDGNPGTFHHKVFVIDDLTVITGSLNFSDNADESNDENVVIISNQEIALEYLSEFEKRWAEAELPDKADMGCK
ncbi:MAG: phospholipase D-like domain-containing protein, partial [Anaerolineaceae bacterium]|nr:phospholipase D-like domain-containing protein [Anaerolineaceae bacterium]